MFSGGVNSRVEMESPEWLESSLFTLRTGFLVGFLLFWRQDFAK